MKILLRKVVLKLKGGYFLFYDPQDKKVLALRLDKVHRERVAHTGGEVYFACSDFRSFGSLELKEGGRAEFKQEGGVIYDLDFWMKRDERGLNVTQIMVHKVSGKPGYNWHEKEGVWKQKPGKVTSQESEKPKLEA